MDAVHQAEQPIDIGVCSEHNRVYQCYCNQCYCLICPSCLMFDTHKGHPVSKIEEGAKQLRKSINTSAKEGHLKFDKTQNVLLDIRHVKLSLQENEQKITKQIEGSFDELISTLKARKKKFLSEVKEHFNNQLKKVQDTQAQWVHKQQLSQKILQLQTSNDDIKLIQQAKQIVEGLQKLQQPLEYKQIKMIENVKSQSTAGKFTTNFNELKDLIKNYMQTGNPIINKLKC